MKRVVKKTVQFVISVFGQMKEITVQSCSKWLSKTAVGSI